jgi:hypothetical protein
MVPFTKESLLCSTKVARFNIIMLDVVVSLVDSIYTRNSTIEFCLASQGVENIA